MVPSSGTLAGDGVGTGTRVCVRPNAPALNNDQCCLSFQVGEGMFMGIL